MSYVPLVPDSPLLTDRHVFCLQADSQQSIISIADNNNHQQTIFYLR